MIIVKVGVQDPAQVLFSEYDDVVQALTANRANQPLHISILPRTVRRCEHLLNTHGIDPLTEILTVDLISISDEVARCRIFRKGFDEQLARSRLRSGAQ